MTNALTRDLFIRISDWMSRLRTIQGSKIKVRMHPTTWQAMRRDEDINPPLSLGETLFPPALTQWQLWQDPACPRRVGGKEPTGDYDEDLRELALEALAQQQYYAQLIIEI